MKLRTAIKIQRYIEGVRFGTVKHKRPSIWKSRTICRRKWADQRVPYMPTDEELHERFEMFVWLLKELDSELDPNM